MASIGLREIEACYALGLAYHREQIQFDDAVAKAVETLKMNKASASDYIRNVRYIVEGRTYKRTINAEAVTYYLTQIRQDLGLPALKTAVQAIESHIAYYEELQNLTLHKTRKAVAEIRAQIDEGTDLESQNAVFQHRVRMSLVDQNSARMERLAKAATVPSKRSVEVTVFQRNPDVVAQALSDAKGKCARCHKPAPFVRKDGTPFLEVHHIIPLVDGGLDNLENVVAICPNCHREAHFGVDPVRF